MTTHICSLSLCDNEFEMNVAGNKKFCSRSCQQKADRKQTLKICSSRDCNNSYLTTDGRSKYCSKSCSATERNFNRGSIRFCFCGSQLRYFQKFGCSKEHSDKIKNDIRVGEWLSGERIPQDKNEKLSAWARNYLLGLAEYRCQSVNCSVVGGWSVPNPVTGKPILTIDHIDGNWKNNSFDNLIVLCYNCHTLTETFGSLNAGSISGTRPNESSRRR